MKLLKMYYENVPFSIGTRVGNSVYHNNAVVHPQDYTVEEYEQLINGNEILVSEEEGMYDFMEMEED